MINQIKKNKYQRFNIPGYAHSLTFSCYKRQKFLNYVRTRMYFIQAVNKAKAAHNLDVWAYVIMPEYVHLLIWPRNEIYSISDILKSIKQSVSRRTIEFLKDSNPGSLRFMATGFQKPRYRFWQDGGGHDRTVIDPKLISEIMDYIHWNPVKRGLVERPEDWYWSSAGDWLNDVEGPIRIDRKSFPLWTPTNPHII